MPDKKDRKTEPRGHLRRRPSAPGAALPGKGKTQRELQGNEGPQRGLDRRER